MDSTNPQTPQQQPQQQHPPQQQSQSQQPQTTPQQQPQQQQQPHQHQPRPPIHPQQHHHQPQAFPPLPQYAPRQPYMHHAYAPPQQQFYYPPPPPQYYYQQTQQTAWPQNPATYPAQPAQPTLANMVNTQPQSNVPQQQPQQQQQSQQQQQQQTNKSSHIIGSTPISDQRTPNSSLQNVTVPNSKPPTTTTTTTNTKPRKLAILRDPKTLEEVPLSGNNVATNTKTSTPVTKPSPIVDQHVTTLLQKVSEEVKDDNKENLNKTKIEKTNIQQKEQQQQQQQQKQQQKQQTPPQQNQQKLQQPQQQKQQHNDKAKPEQVVKVDQNDKQETQAEQPKQQITNDKQSQKVEKLEDNKLEQKQEVDTVVKNVDDKTTEEKKQLAVGQENGKSIETNDQSAAKTTINEDGTTTTTATTIITNVDDNIMDKVDNDGVVEKEEDSSDQMEPLIYEPGQYNPVSNRNGKKKYSRQFLLDVCIKIVKMDPLRLESDDRSGLGGNQSQGAFNVEKVDMFAPTFALGNQKFNSNNRQNDNSRRQSQQNYAGRSSAGQERQRKIITSVSLTQEVELKTTSNPWRPTKDIKEDLPADELETETLKKKFRSILNKLTPNNFVSLAHSVSELNIDTESKLGEVIDIVFAKALAEPGYCVLYGQMCSHLKKISAGEANFGSTLLVRCQHQFQSDIYAGLNITERKEKIENEKDLEVKKQLEEELYEDMFRCRMRGLGLIKFIGELYKIEMLNDKIMLDCIVRLLHEPSEESLECLCDLLATIGEKLDRSTSQKSNEKEKKAPKSAPKVNAYGAGQKSAAAVLASGTSQQQPKSGGEQQTWTLSQVFEELHKIRKNKEFDLSVRIRFKLLDTCELKEKDNWQSKKTKDNNPKKIEEIREAHNQKLEQEKRQNAMGPRRSQEGRRLGHSGGSSGQLSSMAMDGQGGAGVGGGAGYRGQGGLHTSSSSHLIRDHSLGDNIKSNHDDIESQKEHQKKLDCLKNTSFMKIKNFNKSPSTNEPQSLRPNASIYTSKRT